MDANSDPAGADNRSSGAAGLRRKPLAAQLAQELISAILRDLYKPGELIPPEEALCNRFDVSRPVVREAVKTLAKVGMVRTRQGQGSVVLDQAHWYELAPELLEARCETGTAPEVIGEVLELRALLETHASGKAAQRATPEDIERLRLNLKAMQEAVHDRDEFIEHDLQFHADLIRLGGNRLVVSLFELLEPMLRVARTIAFDHQAAPESFLQGVKEHEAIIRALERGSPETLREAMTQHLSWIRSRMNSGDTVRE